MSTTSDPLLANRSCSPDADDQTINTPPPSKKLTHQPLVYVAFLFPALAGFAFGYDIGSTSGAVSNLTGGLGADIGALRLYKSLLTSTSLIGAGQAWPNAPSVQLLCSRLASLGGSTHLGWGGWATGHCLGAFGREQAASKVTDSTTFGDAGVCWHVGGKSGPPLDPAREARVRWRAGVALRGGHAA